MRNDAPSCNGVASGKQSPTFHKLSSQLSSQEKARPRPRRRRRVEGRPGRRVVGAWGHNGGHPRLGAVTRKDWKASKKNYWARTHPPALLSSRPISPHTGRGLHALIRSMEPPDSPPQSPPQQWLHDDTLFSATSEGDLDAVKMKLKSGSDPNETDSDGDRRVLHVCTMPWPERMDIARALLEARADVNATRLNGDTALLQVRQRTHDTLTVPPECMPGRACVDDRAPALLPSSQCCRDDDAELASVLVAGGADVNQRNHRDRASSGVTGDGGGQTPLVICATLGTTAVLKTLLAAPGVDLGMRYHDSTALELARASGNQEVRRSTHAHEHTAARAAACVRAYFFHEHRVACALSGGAAAARGVATAHTGCAGPAGQRRHLQCAHGGARWAV